MRSQPSALLEKLGPDFYDAVQPASFPWAKLRWFNQEAAKEIGLENLDAEQIKKHFWSFQTFENSLHAPLAMRYHGHQFRNYNPELGDGRGFVLAQFEEVKPQGNNTHKKIFDLSTKGSGQTPYSRNGDGRLTLKGAVREILASEMLTSLGVNSSQTFCVFETGEQLDRADEASPTRGAVLTRRVHGSIRFGTFQRLEYFELKAPMQKLMEFSIEHYLPELHQGPRNPQEFLQAVSKRTARLAAELMMAGYVHAVLNTDNMNITGEVFDFGPYRFLPRYNPYFTAAYFDQTGLYSYGRQPESFLWGIEQLGECLKLIEPSLDIEQVLITFTQEFNEQHRVLFFRKLNLVSHGHEKDDELIQLFYQTLLESRLRFEDCFFDFFGGFARQGWKKSSRCQGPREQTMGSRTTDFLNRLKDFQPLDAQRLKHPYFQRQGPERLLIQDMEAVWTPIALSDDWSFFEQKIQNIQSFRGLYSP